MVESEWQYEHSDGLVQDCCNSSALAMELLQSCTMPSIYADLFKKLEHVIAIYIILQ